MITCDESGFLVPRSLTQRLRGGFQAGRSLVTGRYFKPNGAMLEINASSWNAGEFL